MEFIFELIVAHVLLSYWYFKSYACESLIYAPTPIKNNID